jgi:hypothetical protein
MLSADNFSTFDWNLISFDLSLQGRRLSLRTNSPFLQNALLRLHWRVSLKAITSLRYHNAFLVARPFEVFAHMSFTREVKHDTVR